MPVNVDIDVNLNVNDTLDVNFDAGTTGKPSRPRRSASLRAPTL